MFKKYIQDIAKHEARKILLSNYKEKLVYEIKQKKELEEENNIYFNLYQKQVERTEILVKEKDKEISELKYLYEQERNKNYKTLESEELKQEIEKLKKENEQLKNLSCTIVVGNDGKLDSLFNKQLRKENEQLKESIVNLEGKLILKGNLLSEQKKENEKLKGDKEVLEDALEESNNFVAYLEKETKKLNEKLDGIKYVIKKQGLSALTYEKLKDTFMLIERYIKES